VKGRLLEGRKRGREGGWEGGRKQINGVSSISEIERKGGRDATHGGPFSKHEK